MSIRALTGSLIRERRLLSGIKQAVMAKELGISATYLNLIEHNKRRIGGKLLAHIAEILDVDVARLSEGAEAELVGDLRELRSSTDAQETPLEPEEDFAARFPGWAAAHVKSSQRIRSLERTVQALNDRIAYDPALAASLHDVLTSASAIGSAASILTDTKEIEEEWRDRFHRNIYEDSQRLADSSQALVSYLADAGSVEAGGQSAQDELDNWLSDLEHHIPGLEKTLPMSDEQLFNLGLGLRSNQAREAAKSVFARYRQDAKAMPLPELETAIAQVGYDPILLAGRFNVGLAAVLRRLANLPIREGKARIGLVISDHAGALIYRKPVGSFAIPRGGAACPLWPLFQTLHRPLIPVRAVIETQGRDQNRALVYAVAEPVGDLSFDAAPVYQATMLVLPTDLVTLPEDTPRPIGTTCRMCSQVGCSARREASILADTG